MSPKERALEAELHAEREHRQRLEWRLQQLGVNPSLHCGKCVWLQLTGHDDLILAHIPECPRHAIDQRDRVITELLALLKQAEAQVPQLTREIMLAAYHLERLSRPAPPPWHEEHIEWTEEMDLQDEIAKREADALESAKLDLKMLGELREDRYDLLLTNQALRAQIHELQGELTERRRDEVQRDE